MMREATETCLGKRTAHAIRAAAIRLARERAAEDLDPSLAYGCVDWFRYEVKSPPREADRATPPVAAWRGVGGDGASSGH
jgi:hypothetical protein